MNRFVNTNTAQNLSPNQANYFGYDSRRKIHFVRTFRINYNDEINLARKIVNECRIFFEEILSIWQKKLDSN